MGRSSKHHRRVLRRHDRAQRPGGVFLCSPRVDSQRRPPEHASWYAGETILEQGAEGRHFYVIKSGVVRMSREVGGQRHDLGLLGPGDVFGILAAFERQPQRASAIAVAPSTVFAMEAEDLIDGSQESSRPAITVIRAPHQISPRGHGETRRAREAILQTTENLFL